MRRRRRGALLRPTFRKVPAALPVRVRDVPVRQEPDVRHFLTLWPRQLPSRYLYDNLSSALFEAICLLPWYPLTRADMRLLTAHAPEILDPRVASIAELGAGSGLKLAALIRTEHRQFRSGGSRSVPAVVARRAAPRRSPAAGSGPGQAQSGARPAAGLRRLAASRRDPEECRQHRGWPVCSYLRLSRSRQGAHDGAFRRARQELLSADLQRTELPMQLNDAIGLPLTTSLLLDPHVSAIRGSAERCEREACVREALDSHPAIVEARAQVAKAAAAVRHAKYEFLPDLDVCARYTFQNDMPFLADRFGTVGFRMSVDPFDGVRRRAVVRQRESQLAQANENLARLSGEVELRVHTAYNKMERTGQMMAVAEELLALRAESRRVVVDLRTNGAALGSQAKESDAQELEAQAALLQSHLDHVQAADEMDAAVGRRPR